MEKQTLVYVEIFIFLFLVYNSGPLNDSYNSSIETIAIKDPPNRTAMKPLIQQIGHITKYLSELQSKLFLYPFAQLYEQSRYHPYKQQWLSKI